MTALWEVAMRRIADGQMPLDRFLAGVIDQLRKLVDAGRARGALAVPGARPCPASGCTGVLRRREGRHGPFWSCTRYPQCRHTAPEDRARHGGGRSRAVRMRTDNRSKTTQSEEAPK